MSTPFDKHWLEMGACVSIDIETTEALVDEIHRLNDVIDGMALAKRIEQKSQIAFSAEVVGYVAPQRVWVGLTVQEIGAIWDADGTGYIPEKQLQFYMDCETKLREKNI